MSVLAEVYVSDPEDAGKYDEKPHVPSSDRAEFKSLTDLHFAILWAILRDDKLDRAVDLVDDFQNVFTSSKGNRLIYQFPADFVTLLTESDGETIHERAVEE